MAESYLFRTSISGFKKEDVVHYIEYLNTKHRSAVNQLQSEKKLLADELEACKSQAITQDAYNQLAQQLEEAQALIADLQQKLEVKVAQQARTLAEDELAAYRRAEQAERDAKDRAQQMYRQATAVLADATVQLDSTGNQLDALIRQFCANSDALQAAVTAGKTMLQDASAAIAAIHPEE